MLFFNPIKSQLRSAIRYIYFFIRKYPVQHAIASIVIIMHLMPFVFYSTSKLPTAEVPKKLHISTYTLPNPNRVNMSHQTAIKGTSRSKTSVTSSPYLSQDAIHSVQKICNKLQQIEQSTNAASSGLSLPELPKQSTDQTESIPSPYPTILLEYLEKNILLPEQGIVDLQITLGDNGKLISIKIIHSTSKINADFLCTELEKHTFPPFVKNTKEKTFILSFQSNVT